MSFYVMSVLVFYDSVLCYWFVVCSFGSSVS